MIQFVCPHCKKNLSVEEKSFACLSCQKNWSTKNNVPSFAEKDIYWGEFEEEKLKNAIAIFDHSNKKDFYNFIERDLGRTDFIFGKARTDFMYYLPLSKDASVLDVGCGLGIHSFNIAPFVGQVYSFDQSVTRVSFCLLRKKIEEITSLHFFHGEVTSLPFKKDSFNIIMMNGVVEWLGNINRHKSPRQDQIFVLKQMFDYLKKDGVLYIGIENRFATAYLHGIDHNGLRFTSFMPRCLASFLTYIYKGHFYRTYTYSIFGYKKLLKESGFDVKKTDFYIAYPGYNLPQYIIPFNDISALRHFFQTMTSQKGLRGLILRYVSQSDFLIKIARHFFFSYLIYTRK